MYMITSRLLPVLFSLLLLPSVSALQLQDNQFFTLTPNETACLTITLPDDIGSDDAGKQDYLLTTTAFAWADVTSQLVRTDENSTALIPICFSSSDRTFGECSDPYRISIRSSNRTREWRGGVCVSGTRDIDVSSAPAASAADIRSILSSTSNPFDAAFSSPRFSGTPGEPVSVNILIQSAAALRYSIRLLEPVALSATAATSPTSQQATSTLTFIIPASSATLRAEIQANCPGSSCTRQIEAALIVGQDTSAGFDLTLFPQNLNIRTLAPVDFQILLRNHGTARTIILEPRFPADLLSEYSGEAVTLEPGSAKVIPFRATPTRPRSSYETVIRATSHGVQKEAHSILSVDELLTDARLSMANTSTPNTQAAVAAFEAAYPSLSTPTDLQAYQDLQAALAGLPPSPSASVPDTLPSDLPSASPAPAVQINPTLLYLLLVAAAGVIVMIILFRFYKASSSTQEPSDY